MEIKELVPMSPDSFRSAMATRGWTAEMVALRWRMTKRRVQQIVADVDRPRYYDDAVGALPYLTKAAENGLGNDRGRNGGD